MTRIFTEGFEAGDGINFDYWAPYNGVTVTSPARIGGRSAEFRDGWGNPSWKNLNVGSEFYVRVAFYYTGGTSGTNKLFSWMNAGTELGSIRLQNGYIYSYTSTGTLVASGPSTFASDTWHVMEAHVKVADSDGMIQVKVNNLDYTTFSGDTKPASLDQVTRIYFYADNRVWYDDLAINDVNGTEDNSWCGDAHIYGLVANANGDLSQWVGSDGNTTDNYLLVDDLPYNGDTDYVESSTASGTADLYNFTNLSLPANYTVKKIVVETRVRELSADGDSIQLGVKSGSTESWSENKVVSASYVRHEYLLNNNPATGAPWTEAEINALQAGIKVP